MGGHGGLNILPQKRWNVYNFDNREKVKRDEEAAAKEEQIKREQSHRRDSELRLEKLRQARGLASSVPIEDQNKPSSSTPSQTLVSTEEQLSEKKECDANHMNLFEGIRIFDPIEIGKGVEKKKSKFDRDEKKKVKKEEVRVVGPEDEKYRMVYGIAGKDVKLPWYMEKKVKDVKKCDSDDESDDDDVRLKKKRKTDGKKTLEELREERLKRERSEKERERALVMGKSKKDVGFSARRESGFSSRRDEGLSTRWGEGFFARKDEGFSSRRR